MSEEQQKAKIGVLGASGYTGAELLRLLIPHPHVAIALLTAIDGIDWPALKLDLVFCALPHGTTQQVIKDLLARAPATKIVDLSADFRLADVAAYARWYGHPHAAPELQQEAVYGLTEIYRDEIKAARLV